MTRIPDIIHSFHRHNTTHLLVKTVSPHYWPPVTKTKEGLKMVTKSTYPNEVRTWLLLTHKLGASPATSLRPASHC